MSSYLENDNLVASDRAHVSLYTRQNGNWSLTDASGREGVIELPAFGCRLSVGDIYDDVDLPESALR